VYLARFEGEQGSLLQAVLHFPSVPDHGERAFSDSVGRGRLDRMMILLSPDECETALRRCVGAFTRLDTIVPGSVDIPIGRPPHDALLECFPSRRCHLSVSDYSRNGCWISCDFHVYPFLLDLLTQADTLGYEIGYQANVQNLLADREWLREARKNLLQVSGLPGAHDALVRMQEEAVANLGRSVAVIDEYLGAASPESAAWLEGCVRKHFLQRYGAFGFEPPALDFSENGYQGFITTGIHRQLVARLAVEEICNSAVDATQRHAIMAWFPYFRSFHGPGARRILDETQTEDLTIPPHDTVAASSLPVYDGDDDYVFISYKRQEFPLIEPVLRGIVDRGYRLWYDKGIPGGSEWDEQIERKIANCKLLLVFVSPAAVNSKYVRREVKFADALDKQILAVSLQPAELARGMGMLLQQYQMIALDSPDFSTQLNAALRYHGLQCDCRQGQ